MIIDETQFEILMHMAFFTIFFVVSEKAIESRISGITFFASGLILLDLNRMLTLNEVILMGLTTLISLVFILYGTYIIKFRKEGHERKKG